jgi:hypothetical protein
MTASSIRYGTFFSTRSPVAWQRSDGRNENGELVRSGPRPTGAWREASLSRNRAELPSSLFVAKEYVIEEDERYEVKRDNDQA